MCVEEKAEEDAVALPKIKVEECIDIDPMEDAFVAIDERARPLVGSKEMHILARPDIGDECDDATVAPMRDRETCFLVDLAEHALVGTFIGLALAADTNPFAM